MTTARSITMDTPLGVLCLAATDRGLCLAAWKGSGSARAEARLGRAGLRLEPGTSATAARARELLTAYFAGDPVRFDIPLDLYGSAFQQAIWGTACQIGPGETLTYGEVARRTGHPRASRATGAALGANPVAIIVPCHRVVGQNGAVTGYGGEPWRKEWLLAHEAAFGSPGQGLTGP